MKKQIFLITTLFLLTACHTNEEHKYGSSVIEALGDNDNSKYFKKVLKPITFKFPADHTEHNDFQNEWWYYTGNLVDEKNNPYGFQLTFFRRGLKSEAKERESTWKANNIYSAHFTLTDIKNNKFYYTERYARGDLKIAGAKLNPLKVWLENWSLEQVAENTFTIKAEHENVKIAFTLKNLKPIVLNGNKGMSQKSSEQGNASYYYSMTRMETTGSIVINKENFNISGFSWFDREWSTSSLNKKQTGWDWFSLQLNNNREVMLYELRLKDGTTDPFSSGTYIDEKGNSFHLKKEDFKIEVLEHWKSSTTKITYPSKWKILVPKYNLEFIAEPHQSNQELLNSFIYWEGAVKLSGKDITGNGYIELTGYK